MINIRQVYEVSIKAAAGSVAAFLLFLAVYRVEATSSRTLQAVWIYPRDRSAVDFVGLVRQCYRSGETDYYLCWWKNGAKCGELPYAVGLRIYQDCSVEIILQEGRRGFLCHESGY